MRVILCCGYKTSQHTQTQNHEIYYKKTKKYEGLKRVLVASDYGDKESNYNYNIKQNWI